jgi:hypothetical protein
MFGGLNMNSDIMKKAIQAAFHNLFEMPTEELLKKIELEGNGDIASFLLETDALSTMYLGNLGISHPVFLSDDKPILDYTSHNSNYNCYSFDRVQVSIIPTNQSYDMNVHEEFKWAA